MDSGLLEQVLLEIDEYNAQDPKGIELPYSQRLTEWVLKLQPQASEALRIAARGQHVGRWTIPRSTYPMDRAGYLHWREDLKKFHAKTVTGFMEQAGYPEETMERVRSIILKKNLVGDPDVQTLEDGLCLIFLEEQFEDLAAKTPHDKMIEIIRKTWKKMSPAAHQEALSMSMPESQGALIQEALR